MAIPDGLILLATAAPNDGACGLLAGGYLPANAAGVVQVRFKQQWSRRKRYYTTCLGSIRLPRCLVNAENGATEIMVWLSSNGWSNVENPIGGPQFLGTSFACNDRVWGLGYLF